MTNQERQIKLNRATKEGLESPYDVLGMCRHTSSELFEVIDAYERWLDSKALDFLRNTSGVVDVEKALEKCLEKNRQRANLGKK